MALDDNAPAQKIIENILDTQSDSESIARYTRIAWVTALAGKNNGQRIGSENTRTMPHYYWHWNGYALMVN